MLISSRNGKEADWCQERGRAGRTKVRENFRDWRLSAFPDSCPRVILNLAPFLDLAYHFLGNSFPSTA